MGPFPSQGASKDIVLALLVVVAVLWGCSEENVQADPNQERDSQVGQSTITVLGEPATAESNADEKQNVDLLTYEQRQGRYLYLKYCAVCHGEQGKGDGFNAFNLDPKPRNFSDSAYISALSDARLVEAIDEGGRGVNKSPLMPSWGGRLDKQEIEYLVVYVRRLSKSGD